MEAKIESCPSQMLGLTFVPVPDFSAIDVSFGAPLEAYFDRNNLPDVPSEFIDYANTLFFCGGELPKLRDGIDRTAAAKAVTAWLRSWAPPHESKEATVGYALWAWGAELPKK